MGGFLSIQAQDFIEDGVSCGLVLAAATFLSIQAQDFIEDGLYLGTQYFSRDS